MTSKIISTWASRSICHVPETDTGPYIARARPFEALEAVQTPKADCRCQQIPSSNSGRLGKRVCAAAAKTAIYVSGSACSVSSSLVTFKCCSAQYPSLRAATIQPSLCALHQPARPCSVTCLLPYGKVVYWLWGYPPKPTSKRSQFDIRECAPDTNNTTQAAWQLHARTLVTSQIHREIHEQRAA